MVLKCSRKNTYNAGFFLVFLEANFTTEFQ